MTLAARWQGRHKAQVLVQCLRRIEKCFIKTYIQIYGITNIQPISTDKYIP